MQTHAQAQHDCAKTQLPSIRPQNTLKHTSISIPIYRLAPPSVNEPLSPTTTAWQCHTNDKQTIIVKTHVHLQAKPGNPYTHSFRQLSQDNTIAWHPPTRSSFQQTSLPSPHQGTQSTCFRHTLRVRQLAQDKTTARQCHTNDKQTIIVQTHPSASKS